LKDNNYPSQLLKDAVEAIGSLPGVGSRSALRLALHLLKQPKENIHHFAKSIDRLAEEVRYCRVCSMLSDGDECAICADASRDHSVVCVVESVRDVMSIEATGQYHGVYHVLGGIISPINGVAPSDLTIRQLVERIRKGAAANDEEVPISLEDTTVVRIKEVILALSGDVEGETTSFYIFRQLKALGLSDLKVTTLARGLGFGDDLEYADTLTLGRSIMARQPFKG